MKSMVQLAVCGAVSLVLGLPLAAGCAGTEEGSEEAALAATEEAPAVTEETLAAADEIGVLEEGLTSVNELDCSICQIARDCCDAVTDRPGFCANYNAAGCFATLDPTRQKNIKIDCLVLIRYAITAWRPNQPPQCYVPGE